MRDRIREWCVQLGLWLARYGGWDEAPIVEPYTKQLADAANKSAVTVQVIRDLQARMATAATVSQPVLDRAGVLTRDADTTLSGGEAKRHQVYARLIKDFPAVDKRELALAIELALFHAPKEG